MAVRARLPLASLALAAFVALATSLGSACTSSSPPAPPPSPAAVCESSSVSAGFEVLAPSDVAIFVDSADPLLAPVVADLASYLGTSWGTPVTVLRTAPDFKAKRTLWLSTSDAAAAKAGVSIADGYAIERTPGAGGTASIVVYAKDAANLAFGAYALLEELGIRFFHPKQELVPRRASPALPLALDAKRAPLVQQRGLQFHTLHPIEYLAAFNIPSDANLADAKRVIDWLVKTGQNYVQWALLTTVDFPTWRPYAQSIVAYAHARGVRVGSVVQLSQAGALQNSYVLVRDANRWQAEIDSQLAQLMQVPWDVVELGLGEFSGNDYSSPS